MESSMTLQELFNSHVDFLEKDLNKKQQGTAPESISQAVTFEGNEIFNITTKWIAWLDDEPAHIHLLSNVSGIRALEEAKAR